MQAKGFIEIDGVNLEYQWIAGKSVSPVIVLLHEGLGCIGMWKDFPPTLADQTGLNVFVYSRQGYGGSDACELPRPVCFMHDEAEVLGKVLERLPGESFILVGHSDGASIASIYAGSNPANRVVSLVLIAPHFFVEPISVDSIQKAKVLYETTDLRDRLKKYHGDRVDNAFRGWNDVWLSPEFRNWNITDYLPQINTPTLVIQGQNDEYGSEAQMTTAQQLIPVDVEVCLLADCGHSPHRQFSGETVDVIKRFLSA